MKSPIRSAKPFDSILHAREIMEKHRINQLPVLVDGKLVGIVTDRDLRDAFPSAFAGKRKQEAFDAQQITVESVMTTNVLTAAPRDDVIAVARLMRQERIGAVPIVDSGRVVGILTRSDLLDALVGLELQLAERRGKST